ncbi:MAG: hypothetical protein LBH98_03930 [Chitinispirillales bacterium]|jgi:hypothetical protein|nr:hypothetical protein [Chitinispirillales bacterium]
MRDFIKFKFAGVLAMLVMCAAFGAAVMLLWNALMPKIFVSPQINYPQAVGLLILVRLLFGGIGGGQSYAIHQIGKHGNKLRERWINMNEDERMEFIKKEKDFFRFREKFSGFHGYSNDERETKQSTTDNEKRNKQINGEKVESGNE